MSTLEEIQALVNDAQDKISKGNLEDVTKVTWPRIRTAINEYPGLHRDVKMQLTMLISARLDVLGLVAANLPVNIDVKKLTQLIQERSAEPSSQKSIPDWFPW